MNSQIVAIQNVLSAVTNFTRMAAFVAGLNALIENVPTQHGVLCVPAVGLPVKVNDVKQTLPAIPNFNLPQYTWFSETKSYDPLIEDAVYVNDQTSAFVFIGFPGEQVALYRDAFNVGDEVGPHDGHHLIVTIPKNNLGVPGVVIVKSLDPNVHPPQAFPDAGSVVEIPRGDSEQDAISAVVFGVT